MFSKDISLEKISDLKYEISKRLFLLDKVYQNKIFCYHCGNVDIKKYSDIFLEDLDVIIKLLHFLNEKIYSKKNFTKEEIKNLVLYHKFLIRYKNKLIIWFKIFEGTFFKEKHFLEFKSIVNNFYHTLLEELKLLDYYIKLTLRNFIEKNKIQNIKNRIKTSDIYKPRSDVFFPRKRFMLLLKKVYSSLSEFLIFLEKLNEKIIFLEKNSFYESFFVRKKSFEELYSFLIENFNFIFWDEKNVKDFVKTFNSFNKQEREKFFSLLDAFKKQGKNHPSVRMYSPHNKNLRGTIIELGHKKDVVRILFENKNGRLVFLKAFKTDDHDGYEKYLNNLLYGKAA